MRMDIIEKKISEIRPYEKNPRRNDDAVDVVARARAAGAAIMMDLQFMFSPF